MSRLGDDYFGKAKISDTMLLWAQDAANTHARYFMDLILKQEEKQMDRQPTILEEAQQIVHCERPEQYGHPAGQYQRVAKMFNALTGTNITAAQAAMFMILVKLDRENFKPKRDNRVDGAGYFGVLDMVREAEEADENKHPWKTLIDERELKPGRVEVGPFPDVCITDRQPIFEDDHLILFKKDCKDAPSDRPIRPNIDEPRRHG